MSLAALARQLADAGTPIEGIILALEAVEQRERAAAVKREQAAARKRAQRDRERDGSVTVTRQSQDSHETTPAPNKSPPDPQKLTPTPAPTHETRAREAFPKPDWADGQVWSDLLANRRKKGLPNTATAHRKLLADIDRLTDDAWPPGRVLEAAVGRGWGAIYASLKDDDDGRRNGTHTLGRNHRPVANDRTIDALSEWALGR